MTPSDAVLIVGISGGSCSGKTTLARMLVDRVGAENCGLLFQDSYYLDQSRRFKEDGGEVNFDHPDALEFTLLARHLDLLKKGQNVEVPIYDFVTHRRLERTERFEPKPVVLLDGTLILSQPIIRDRLDHAVFVDASEAIRFERRKQRDVRERGRALEGVIRQFQNHVKPMHDAFVEPSKSRASAFFDGATGSPEAIRTLLGALRL